MKICRKWFAFILAVLTIVATPCSSYAANAENINIGIQYEEYHDQINFDGLMVFSVNKKDVVVEVDPTISWHEKLDAERQLCKYNKYVERHPEAVSELLDSVNNSDLVCAISYTEAPLIYVVDHFERIPKNSVVSLDQFTTSATSTASTRYNLTLKTSVTRAGSSNPYTYTAKTYGTWDNSISVFTGKKKPAGGNDFVLQSCPTVTSETSFSSRYNYKTSGSIYGIQGKNYFLSDGGDSWAKYEVVDDPTGLAQLKTFELVQKFKAISTTKTKKINSYYIHTWEAMSVSVSVGGEVGMSGKEPSAGVSLSITPSITDKQWQLYNYVSFDW